MLFCCLCAACAIRPLINRNGYREFIFILTVVVSLFFFDSKDPIVGMPIYMCIMLLSIILGVFSGEYYIGTEKRLLTMCLLIVAIMLFSITTMGLGINVQKALLIKLSLTDTWDVASQLFYPTLNITVVKHFLFCVAYLMFLFFNSDILQKKRMQQKLLHRFINIFKILFAFLIIEFVITNVCGVWRDIKFFPSIFNTSINMIDKWGGFGGWYYVSVAWFAEPASVGCTLIVYYLIRMAEKRYSLRRILWDLCSVVAAFTTGSSTALIISIIYVLYTVFYLIFINKMISLKLVGGLVLLVGCVVVARYSTTLFGKIRVFLSGEISWGSGSFRRQSINYAIDIIKYHPLFGLGIGTVYCHSGLFQTVANIGLVGTGLLVYAHVLLLRPKMSPIIVFKIVFVVGISMAAFMIQQITSPFMCALMIAMFAKPKEIKERSVIYIKRFDTVEDRTLINRKYCIIRFATNKGAETV